MAIGEVCLIVAKKVCDDLFKKLPSKVFLVCSFTLKKTNQKYA